MGLARHQVLSDSDSKEVCAVYVDAPQLTHAINRVVDSIIVLGETGTGDEVVDLSVLLDDILDAALHRVGIRNIGVVGGDLGNSGSAGVLIAEYLDKLDSLSLSFFLCWVGEKLLAHGLRTCHGASWIRKYKWELMSELKAQVMQSGEKQSEKSVE